MPPLCADNNNLLACMASSARQEASLVAIAQQLMQHQHQHKHHPHPYITHHTQQQQQSHHAPPQNCIGGGATMDHWATSWQGKTEDFAHSLYSDAICDSLPFTAPDLSTSALVIPSLDSYIPESEFLVQKDLSKHEEEAPLSSETPELSQTLTNVDDIGGLVEGVLAGPNTGQLSFADTQVEWMMDCLMYDDTDDPMVPCLETNPCESTHSSEPAGASSGWYPGTPLEDALPDAFALMEAADFCTPVWAQDAGNGVPNVTSSQDVVGMSHDMVGMCASAQDMMGMQSKRGRAGDGAGGCVGEGMNVFNRKGSKASMSSTSVGERGRMPSHPNQVPAHGVRLMQLLLECAKAVENDHQRAAIVIPQLKGLATRYGDPIQRLASYFTDALAKRLARAQGRPEPRSPGGECSAQELTLAYQAMSEACPYFTFAQLTANQAILEAIEEAGSVHIVDFGISQGVQWAAMLQAIAAREGGPPPIKIRITGVASPELGEKWEESLSATGRRLTDFACSLHLNLDFQYAPVALDDATLAPDMFDIEEGEVVVVNFMLELCNLLDGATEAAVTRTLRVAADLSPRVVTVAEMDAHLNTGPFQKRFVSALHFFSAMFDSLEAGMIRDSVHRHCMERWLLGERIHAMVGGRDDGPRRRLQGHVDWSTAFRSSNFRPCPLSHYAISQARILLWRYCESFTLNEQEGSLSLGWQNKALLTVSAWTIDD